MTKAKKEMSDITGEEATPKQNTRVKVAKYATEAERKQARYEA